MADPSEIKYAEELLRLHLMEWRDAGGHVECVTGAILQLIVARERFAEAVRAGLETPPEYQHGGRPMTLRECMEAEEPACKQCSSQEIAEGKCTCLNRWEGQ